VVSPPAGDAGASPSREEPFYVLVVEDKAEDAEHLRGILDEVSAANGMEPRIDEARTYTAAYDKILTSYYDLIVLDLVLRSGEPGEIEDWEGLWLLQDLHELHLQEQTAVVVLTQFSGSGDAVNRAYGQFAVASFWSKKTTRAALLEHFQEFLEERRYFGLGIEVEFEAGSGWPELITALAEGPFRRLGAPMSHPDAEVELNHLLRRLIDECARVSVTRMEPGKSGAAVLRIGRHNDDGGRIADVLVKYGAAEQIREEVANWEGIRDLIKDYRLTQLERSATGRYLGAIEYKLIGAEAGTVMQFGKFYETRDVLDVERCLDELLRVTCSLWYERENRVEAKALSIADHYSAFLGFTTEEIKRAYGFKFGLDALHEPSIEFTEVPRPLPHPIRGMIGGWKPRSFDTFLCKTHGDMHGANLLVDAPNSIAWMIDFANTGNGHWARDLCMLETCIKFQYLPVSSLEKLFTFEESLLVEGRLDADFRPQWEADLDFDKAARSIHQIRSFAAEAAEDLGPEQAFEEYCAALFYTTVSRFRFHDLLKQRVRKRHLIVSAALLFERLGGRVG
jgi:CheY-like chemotaxis protein